jgi:tRNA dimethylallyltransferase
MRAVPERPPLLLAGPTAVGKSEVALRLAEMLGGEVISVDSMQVYRGLDIGTAKPSQEERARVPHHLIDILDLTESFHAAQFAQRAHAAVAEIVTRGQVPILCGGTGLYFKAFLEGLGSSPPGDDALRAELQKHSLAELLIELERRDPATFASIDRANPRRVIRALEVIRLTGKPFSAQRAPWSKGENAISFFYGVDRSPAKLQARIDTRVDKMFQRGLVEETRSLLARGLEQNPAAMQAIGYRQVVEHLRGERSLADTIALVKTRTRQFAKRQRTWFRRQAQVQWFQASEDETTETLAERVAALWRKESAENRG